MRAILATLLICLFAMPASAKHHHHRHAINGGQFQFAENQSYAVKQKRRHRTARKAVKVTGNAPTIMPHPPGCPQRAFCGCGVSLFVFGKAVAQGGLAIAAEWLRFPRAEPGPGMVAARRGHVFAILKNLGRGKVLAYDPNSGRHQTRIHVRSLRGFAVVDPHGGKTMLANLADRIDEPEQDRRIVLASVDDGKPTKYDGGHYHGHVATGERFDGKRLGVAHRTLPLNSCVEVGHNGRLVQAVVNDRGPCASRYCQRRAPWLLKRELDMTPELARRLNFNGLDHVSLRPVPCAIASN